VAAWNRETVEAGGLRLSVARRGSGYPLLLIAGVGAHIEMWSAFAAHAGERELVALDAPGAGLSPAPRVPLPMCGLATA
jgi:pimeloyl-ACP methyl ester carboxylesterase